MERPLRFGIVGCGVIAGTHADAITSLPDAKLAAVADVDLAAAQHVGQKYGVAAYGSLAEMLERTDLDVVTICTPSGMHGEQAVQTMRSGRHVIVEKPMEIRAAAVEEMLRVQAETGVKLAVISQRRFDQSSQQVRRLVEEGAFGRLVLGNAHVLWWRSQGYYDSGVWRGTWELDGGGVLMNQSIHSIDLLTWFMGPVRSVFAYAGTLAHHMETEDVAVATLRFANGALGVIVGTTAAYPGVTTRVEVLGDRGSAVLENDRLAFLHLARDDVEEAPAYGVSPRTTTVAGTTGTVQNPSGMSADGHARQIADMMHAIREDGEPLVDGYAGRLPVQVILAIYDSARTGKEVFLA
jgi:predicted dehydrogenase